MIFQFDCIRNRATIFFPNLISNYFIHKHKSAKRPPDQDEILFTIVTKKPDKISTEQTQNPNCSLTKLFCPRLMIPFAESRKQHDQQTKTSTSHRDKTGPPFPTPHIPQGTTLDGREQIVTAFHGKGQRTLPSTKGVNSVRFVLPRWKNLCCHGGRPWWGRSHTPPLMHAQSRSATEYFD